MHSGRILLLALAIVSAEVIGYRHYRSDMAAWRAVQQSLANLHNALEREPAGKIAAPIASARAAVEAFAAAAHRFPRDHRARLQAAERGLHYLALAAQGAESVRNWEAMSAYSDVTKLLPRGCDGDHLAFSPALISEAFAVAGSYFIRKRPARHRNRNAIIGSRGSIRRWTY